MKKSEKETESIQLPENSQNLIDQVWSSLPQTDKDNLQDILKGIPLSTNPMNMLLDLLMMQYKIARSTQKQVAIVGPANVGKSTLYNQFIREKTDKAVVSPIPGTTRENQEGNAGLFSIIDTPGADAIGSVGQAEHDEAYSAASDADFIILLFDAVQGIKQSELDIYHDVLALNKPYLILLNKIDLVKKYEQEVIKKTAENLHVTVEEIIPISAIKNNGIAKVVMSIAAMDPELVIALGQAMPDFREKLAWRVITSSSALSAAVALTPLPVIDFIPLVINQGNMVINIARIYNYKINLKRAKELITTFGLGMLGRSIFQQLSKAGGLPGWLLSSAIATSMTVAMGYAAMTWFEKGEKLSMGSLKVLTETITQKMISTLKQRRKRKPGKGQISQDVIDVFEDGSIIALEDLHEITKVPDPPTE